MNSNEQLSRHVETVSKQTKDGLTPDDRHFMKAYLGYCHVKNVKRKKKEMDGAGSFVRHTLWPSDRTKKEDEEFDLTSFLRNKDGQDVPRIFRKDDDPQHFKTMFEEAVEFNATQEAGVVRGYQVLFVSQKKAQTHRQTHTDRHTDTPADTQTHTQTHRHTDTRTHTHRHTHTNETDRHRHRHRHRHTNEPTDRHDFI